MHFNAKIISDLNELEQLGASWRGLSLRLGDNTGFFSSWEFVHALLAAVVTPGWRVLVFYADDDPGQPVAIFPLELIHVSAANGAPICMAAPMGARFASYVEFSIVPQYRSQIWTLLLNVLSEHCACDALFLGTMLEDSPNFQQLCASMGPQQMAVVTSPGVHFIVTRGRQFDEFFAEKKYSTLRDARRCERGLKKIGELEFSVNYAGSDRPEQVRRVLQMLGSRFGKQHFYGSPARWIPMMERLADVYGDSGLVEFSSLCLDGRVIAAQLGFHYFGRRYHYMAVYEPEFARYSPSKVLLSRLLEHTFDEGGIFCFGAGAFDYKQDWCEQHAELKMPCIFLTPRARSVLEPYLTLDAISRLFV